MENIVIRLVKPDDAQSLTDFLKKRFSVNGAPLISKLKPPQHEVDFIVQYMVSDALAKPDNINSFVAIDKSTGAIVGCALMILEDRKVGHGDSDIDGLEISANTQSLIDFSRLMWSGVEEFLPENYSGPYIRMELGLVHPEYRRYGLLKTLTQTALRRALNNFGCRYGIANCTSYKTQIYGEQEGWSTLRWINYEDYYVLGKKLFNFEKGSNEKCAKLMLADIKKSLEGERKAKL